MAVSITIAGTYGAGDYVLGNDITTAINNTGGYVAALKFTGAFTLNLNGKKLTNTAGPGTTSPILSVGVESDYRGTITDSSPTKTGKITGYRVGAKLFGADSDCNGVDLSGNLYIGAWIEGDNSKCNGLKVEDIGGISDEAYAIGIEVSNAEGVEVGNCAFKNIYRQANHPGSFGDHAGVGLAVNFSASSSNGRLLNSTFENDLFQVDTIGAFLGSGGGHVVSNFWHHNIFIPVQRATANNSKVLSALGSVATSVPATSWPATPSPKIVFASDSNGTTAYVSGSANIVSLIGAGIPGATMVNASITGNKSWQLRDRLAADVIAQNPDVVMVMIGANDAAIAAENNTPASIWISQYLANMSGIIDQLQAADITKIMIASPPPARVVKFSNEWPQAVEGLKALCAVKGVRYVPIYEAFASAAINDLALSSVTRFYREAPDQYHWDTAGHALAAPVFIAAYEANTEAPEGGEWVSGINTGVGGWAADYWTEMTIPANTLPASGKLTITLGAPSENGQHIIEAWAGSEQLSFGGSASKTIAAGAEATANETAGSFDKTAALVIKVRRNTDAYIRVRDNMGAGFQTRWATAANPTSWSNNGTQRTAHITKISVAP